MSNQLTHISKLLSLVLRHNPAQIGLTLDNNGWANVGELIEKVNTSGTKLDMQLLKQVVDENTKKRFSFNEDFTKIRANQGHSVEVDVELKEVEPPAQLYHGTASRFIEMILQQGLLKMERLHVHLSDNAETAKTVGGRHGKPVVLIIDSREMSVAGHKFYLSQNNVWLTDNVPVKYIIR